MTVDEEFQSNIVAIGRVEKATMEVRASVKCYWW